jgi:peroxiredoxin
MGRHPIEYSEARGVLQFSPAGGAGITRRRSLARSLLLIGAGVIGFGLLVTLALAPAGSDAGPARIGAPVADFTLADLNGKMVRLSDYRGRPVLINGWATWCPPCRAEMPALHDFYLAHQADGFALLAVNAGESGSTVASFIAQSGFTFPVLLDSGEGMLHRLGVKGLPTSILIGRDGIVKYIHTGAITPELLETRIAPLLD